MHIDTRIITAYLEDYPISKEVMYPYIKNYHKPDSKRKDVVRELLHQLETIVNDYPTFNPDLCNMLFADKEDYLETLCICPIVGSNIMYYCDTQQNKKMIFIDFLCVANHTPIISQMVYILNNVLSLEISKACILLDYPLQSKEYDCLLNEVTFVHGLAHWISWNASCEQYVFHTEKYEPHREKAFGLLAQAMQIDNKVMQRKILTHIQASNLWDQFPVVAGMFYFDDIFREFGNKGIKQLYAMGPKDLINRIYSAN